MLGHSKIKYETQQIKQEIAELKRQLKDIEKLPHMKIPGLVRLRTGNGHS